MRLNEGLVGLVAEEMRPQAFTDAARHPRFKFFPEAGEDVYHTLLGCRWSIAGPAARVLVVQTTEPRSLRRRSAACWWRRPPARPLVSELRTLGQFVAPAYERLRALAHNLWWCWDRETHSLFREFDPVRWRESTTTRSPLLAACRSTSSRSAAAVGAAQPDQLCLPADAASIWKREDLGSAQCRRALGAAGGLFFGRVRPARIGADLFRRPGHPVGRPHQERSDLGIPLVAIGLYYDQGYFRQQLDDRGWQQENYIDVE